MADGIEQRLGQAQAAHQRGALSEAKTHYDAILAQRPDHFGALQGLGLLAYQTGALAIAETLLDRAAAARPGDAPIHFHRGNLMGRMDRTQDALACYDRALALDPSHAAAHANRGVMLERLGRLDDAIAAFDRAIAVKPDLAAAHFSRGNALQQARRFSPALESYDRVLALQPGHAEAWNNRGNALKDLRRNTDALASFERAIQLRPDSAIFHLNRGKALKDPQEALATLERAIALDATLVDAHVSRGNLLCDLARPAEALASFDQGLALDTRSAVAWLGRGNALFLLRRADDAMTAYDQALTRDRGMAKALLGRGNILFLRKDLEQALAAYDKALAFDPELENAWAGRGTVLQRQGRYDLAAPACGRLLALNPNHPFTKGTLLHLKMLACDWSGIEKMIAEIESGMAKGRPVAAPFGWQGISSSPQSLQRCAELTAAKLYPPLPSLPHPAPGNDKIRIGYLSGEFRDQATSQLLVGVLEQHDRSRFEIIGFDNGRDDGSITRSRVTAAMQKTVPISAMGDEEAVATIRSHNIDILVNLNGWFGDHRMAVFAHRAAPLQVNWLGFPGTLGAPYMDYIVADRMVIPEQDKAFFTEKVAWLPHCYQPNDRAKPIAGAQENRAQHGLPPAGFVFCCFNNSYKILPAMFERWMRLLQGVPGSVLWLVDDNELATANLKGQADAHGINPARLVFAPRLPLPQHLARHRLADLFLDTLPSNAHTTASDALWAGLPVLTCRGSAFAGRVAASLLTGVGLPELIAETPDEYESMALALARDPARLATLKEKLAANRLTTPLFDTAGFTRDLEAAFTAMQERRRSGLAPDHIALPGTTSPA